MDDALRLGGGFRSEVLRRDASAGPWLDGLPALWRRLSEAWGLTAVGAARTGRTSVVLPVVSTTGVRAALKLVSPVVPAAAEVSALQAFDGHGAVRLLDADPAAGALLLEWLAGPALDELADQDAAVAVAGRLAAELAAATPPVDAPRLAAGAAGWSNQLHEQHENALRDGSALPEEHLERALRVIAELGADDTSTPTHGDLSLANVLGAADGRWVAIDPLLVVGTTAHEAHTVVRSHLGDLVGADDLADLLRRRTTGFAAAAGVDPARALALSFARFVSSAYWESQHDGARDDVARLRQAALALGDVV